MTLEPMFPSVEVIWQSRDPDRDVETAKEFQRAAQSETATTIPGLEGLWLITEINVIDGLLVVKGVPVEPTLADDLAAEGEALRRRMVHATRPKRPLSLNDAIALHKRMDR